MNKRRNQHKYSKTNLRSQLTSLNATNRYTKLTFKLQLYWHPAEMMQTHYLSNHRRGLHLDNQFQGCYQRGENPSAKDVEDATAGFGSPVFLQQTQLQYFHLDLRENFVEYSTDSHHTSLRFAEKLTNRGEQQGVQRKKRV